MNQAESQPISKSFNQEMLFFSMEDTCIKCIERRYNQKYSEDRKNLCILIRLICMKNDTTVREGKSNSNEKPSNIKRRSNIKVY